MFHNDLKKSKNQKIIRISGCQDLEYTQGILHLALDARSNEAQEFLKLKNVQENKYSSPPFMKSLVYNRICSILKSNDESFKDIINHIDEYEDVLKAGYDSHIGNQSEIELISNPIVQKYYGSLIKVNVDYDVDFNKIKKKSDSSPYENKTKQHFYSIRLEFPRKMSRFIHNSILSMLPRSSMSNDGYFLKQNMMNEYNT